MLKVKQINKVIQNHVILKDISFTLEKGKCLAIVGESGSGKSTLASIIMGRMKATTGEILLKDNYMNLKTNQDKLTWYQSIQLIIQNNNESLDPTKRVKSILKEPIKCLKNNHQINDDFLVALLKQVGLNERILKAKPRTLSGGEYQRVCIAKSLASSPDLLICDEITANLDVINEHRMLELLKNLQNKSGLSFLIITHKLSIANQLADDILVLNKGEIVDYFNKHDLFSQNRHPLTKQLLEDTHYLEKYFSDNIKQ